jgi:hypothetical protein
MTDALTALEGRVHADLARIAHPETAWLTPRLGPDGRPALDVLVVGAGQSGLATAFGLMRSQVTNILVLDRSDEGREGPWLSYARMPTLRSPKHFTGPDLDVPSLTYQSWHEARFGEQDWRTLDLIPRELWAEYLLWFRRVVSVPVRNSCEVTEVGPAAGGLLALQVRSAAGLETVFARKIVLATGQEGMGDWTIPEALRDLPSSLCVHAAQPIDFARLRGKKVAVIGAGASAFDNAATALEQGAAEVHLAAVPRCSSSSPTAGSLFAASCGISVIWTMPGAGVSCAPFSKCARAFRKRLTIAAPATPIFVCLRVRRSRPPQRRIVLSFCGRRPVRSRLILSSAAPAST